TVLGIQITRQPRNLPAEFVNTAGEFVPVVDGLPETLEHGDPLFALAHLDVQHPDLGRDEGRELRPNLPEKRLHLRGFLVQSEDARGDGLLLTAQFPDEIGKFGLLAFQLLGLERETHLRPAQTPASRLWHRLPAEEALARHSLVWTHLLVTMGAAGD